MMAGYGNMGPNDCWWIALLITIQSMVGLLMDAIVIGVIFARISHPKYRGRTIAISDSAVISRRDGVLKFMFRIADFRRTQVGVRVHALGRKVLRFLTCTPFYCDL
jgi:hypothetical protein